VECDLFSLLTLVVRKCRVYIWTKEQWNGFGNWRIPERNRFNLKSGKKTNYYRCISQYVQLQKEREKLLAFVLSMMQRKTPSFSVTWRKANFSIALSWGFRRNRKRFIFFGWKSWWVNWFPMASFWKRLSS